MEHTITISGQIYRALKRQASQSHKEVDALVEDWLQERLDLGRSPGSKPVEYHEITGKSEALRETRPVDQETVTLELPSEVYEGLRELAEEDQVDLIRELAGLVKRAQLLEVRNVKKRETPASEETDPLRRIASMAQDLGIDDLAEQHDHYLYGTEKR